MLSNLTSKLHEAVSSLTDPHHSDAPASDAPHAPSSRTHALDQLTHSLRALHVQYSPQVPASLRPLQLVITSEKSLALAFESVAQSARAHSRDLFLWGQEQAAQEDADVKDVTDRLAFLSFSSGALASALSTALATSARAPLKQLRDAEQLLAPRRAARAAAQSALSRARTEKEKQELIASLRATEGEDTELEARAHRARREGVREAERAKWAAVREYADKLLLLARGADQLIALIPPVPTGAPSAANLALAGTAPSAPAYGPDEQKKTADIRSAVQHALDTYAPAGPLEPLPALPEPSTLSRAASDRRGFGETHLPEINTHVPGAAADLSTPASALAPPGQGITAPPPSAILPQSHRFVAPTSSASAGPGSAQPQSPPSSFHRPTPASPLAQAHSSSALASPPPLNPAVLNQAPAPLPPPTTSTGTSSTSTTSAPSSSPAAHSALPPTTTPRTSGTGVGITGISPVTGEETTSTTTGAVPTIAETGLPVGQSPHGPGPKSGNLRDLRGGDAAAATAAAAGAAGAGATWATPAPPVPPRHAPAGTGTGAGFPSAEEEKRALERAERDRILLGRAGSSAGRGPVPPPKDATTTSTSASASASAAAGAPGPSARVETESERLAREEKQRLEREERERVLRGEGGGGPGAQGGQGGQGQGGPEDDLPPYAA